MMDGTRVTLTCDGFSTPVGAGGLFIGPCLNPQPVRNNTATSKTSLFTEFPLDAAADPTPVQEGTVCQPQLKF